MNPNFKSKPEVRIEREYLKSEIKRSNFCENQFEEKTTTFESQQCSNKMESSFTFFGALNEEHNL